MLFDERDKPLEDRITHLESQVRELEGERDRLLELRSALEHQLEETQVKWADQASRDAAVITRIRALEAALRQIAEHRHCDYECTENCDGTPARTGDFDDGIRRGHRCAAAIARKAL